MSKVLNFTFVFVASILGILSEQQFIPDSVPPEFIPLYKSDLDTWKAPEQLVKNYPYYLSGYDEDDCTVWVIEFGHWNVRKILEEGKEAKVLFDKYVNQAVLTIYNSTYSKHEICEAIIIIDMDEYDLSQLTSPLTLAYVVEKVKLIVTGLRNAKIGYFLNTNFVAQRFLTLIKPILGKEYEKVEIFGTNPANWKPRILKKIPASQLPSWYGGNSSFKPVKVYG